MMRITVLSLLVFVGCGGGAPEKPAPRKATYYVGHGAKFINIVFTSEAEFETIVGTTHTATGTLEVDTGNQTGSIDISVPVASLKTGIDTRDEHLRSAPFIDGAKHPEIRFKSNSIAALDGSRLEVAGDFTMNGVTQPQTVTVKWRELPHEATKKARFGPGRWIKFQAEFVVSLSEHGVEMPDMVIGKVEDAWMVRMTVYAGTEKPK